MSGVSNVLESVREDDFVEYYLFPSVETDDDNEEDTQLSTLLHRVNEVVTNVTENYLWHKDPFKLIPRTTISNCLSHINGKTEQLPPHLYGVSHFGDNIEDEWFIVYIVLQITKEIPGLIGKVYDVDGEFLLIESADYLPIWANPEVCDNRVYIFNGNIHILLPELTDKKITIAEALLNVRNNPALTLAAIQIQNAIHDRLDWFPNKIEETLHRATIYVPIGVANILKHKPSLIAPAVLAFCNRDSVDLKACKAMKYFPPENRINTSVTFTKYLYAMLTHSKYVPDRRTGWNLPQPSSLQYKAHSLGVKVACGFEILISQAKPSTGIDQDKGWHNYLNSLKNKNYFNGLIENSKGYNDLLNKAKEYYVNHRDSMHYTPAIGQEVLELTKKLDCNIEEFKNNEKSLPKDDDESWLSISPDDLDKMLQEKYGQKKFTAVNSSSDAAGFTEKVTNFLNHMSEVEGVEFPDGDDSPVRPPRRNKSKGKHKVSWSQETKTEVKQTNNKVNFDANSFSCAVQGILNFAIPEDSWDLESDSDMSEYENDNYVKVESYEEIKNDMKKYMEEMDKELASTTIGESFEKKNGDGFEDIENFKPVDIDMNALKNILESYKSQLGDAGPSSNMLGPMGMHLDTSDSGDVD